MRDLLTAKRLLLQSGTIVDATIIAAPSSTKNAAQARDPEMPQTRKGNTWFFGMKLQVGTDPRGRVHRLTATERAIYGIGRTGARGCARRSGGVGCARVQRRGTKQTSLSPWLAKNTARAFTLFPLANLYMVRDRLLPAGATCRR